ncbi:DUF624 domain-containing protein [Microbacterium ulmi]|uniref:DUF624 domain-containing protein n=1 Tax=Microbacterium ulmi TaxID=179095 RepID=A0A7Y2M224_9MICO|nr:DUF624 domain-containing protein [Microbacterium ulmi]NII70006.1 putative membrane protein YesL [Microbacterium ulmi]NNH04564.1 DUF624 domain-containing protein [Microbacterium ulmi]
MSEKKTLGGSDAFGRVTGAVYWYIVVEIAFALAGLPGVVGIVLLEPVPNNIPLYALCLVPILPAFSAAIAALRARRRSEALDPWRQYWRRWLANVKDVLVIGIPALAVLALFGFNIAFGDVAGGVFVIVAMILGAVVALWLVHALVIASLFSFRTRDTMRLAAYYLIAKPLVTLGVLSLVVIATAAAAVTSSWVLLVAGSVLAGLVLMNARAMIADIETRFVAEDAGEAASGQ